MSIAVVQFDSGLTCFRFRTKHFSERKASTPELALSHLILSMYMYCVLSQRCVLHCLVIIEACENESELHTLAALPMTFCEIFLPQCISAISLAMFFLCVLDDDGWKHQLRPGGLDSKRKSSLELIVEGIEAATKHSAMTDMARNNSATSQYKRALQGSYDDASRNSFKVWSRVFQSAAIWEPLHSAAC